MNRLALALALGLTLVLGIPRIAWAEGIAKKVCIIEDPPGTIIQQTDAPSGSSAAAYCIEQMQKLLKDNPARKVSLSIRLGCFTQDIHDWADGLHDVRSQPCQSLP
jgi:hypothetical protein